MHPRLRHLLLATTPLLAFGDGRAEGVRGRRRRDDPRARARAVTVTS